LFHLLSDLIFKKQGGVMFEDIPFTHVEGIKKEKSLKLFSLTTCGFCRRAKAYLDTQGFDYEMVYADELDVEVKTRIKDEFKKRFDSAMHFPTLIINEEEYMVGFIKPDWEQRLEEPA